METIRYNTFETNSSSQHALVLYPRDKFKSFKNKESIWVPSKEFKLDWNNGEDEDSAPIYIAKDDEFFTIENAYENVMNSKKPEDEKFNWAFSLKKCFTEYNHSSFDEFKKYMAENFFHPKIGLGVYTYDELYRHMDYDFKILDTVKKDGKLYTGVYMGESC